MSSRAEKQNVPAIAAVPVSAAVRVAYLFVYAARDPLYDHLLHDAKRYHEWASALAAGKPWEAGSFHQAPLYPYLVALAYALVGARPLAVYVIQLLCGLATIFLVWRIGSLARNRRAGLVAGSILALHGVLVFHVDPRPPGGSAPGALAA